MNSEHDVRTILATTKIFIIILSQNCPTSHKEKGAMGFAGALALAC
jgi:hypothetical protein